MKTFKIFIFALVTITILIGCDPTIQGQLGTLILVFDEDMGAKTLEPDAGDLVFFDYLVEGSGPGGTSFTRIFSGSTGVVPQLAPGDWTIDVTGRNTGAVDIGFGTTPVTVIGGDVASATVNLSPMTGTGLFELNISWPTDTITTPVAVIELGGTPLLFDLTATSVTFPRSGFFDNVFSDGYHLLTVQVWDDTDLRWGRTEAVRIMTGLTTTGTFDLTSAFSNQGEISLTIDTVTDMENPIGITFSGVIDPLPYASSMTVTATPDQAVTSYQWYLNGAIQVGETSSSITVGPSFTPGTHRLTVVVDNGTIISSEGFLFEALGP